MNVYEVLKRPLVTERSSLMIDKGVYTFEVDRNANKNQIREAVETIFKVKVVTVNTLRIHRKQRGRGPFAGHTGLGKKAIVRLQPGDKIDIFESA
jgi:large subunit ribosomal protein L23